MPSIKIKNTEMVYFSFGNGVKHFVIIPGISIKPVSLSASAVEAAYSSLTDEYTVTVFDRIKNPPPDYSVYGMADDTAFAMQSLGIKNADIFGCSQGGMIAEVLAARYKQLTRSIILCSAFARANENSKRIMNRWIKMAECGDRVGVCTDMPDKIYSKEFSEKYKEYFFSSAENIKDYELRDFAIITSACNTFDFYGELSKIKCPAFVIGSEDDRVLTPDGSYEIAKKLNCAIYMYNGFGHAVYDEAPDFLDRVKGFLRGLD